MKTIFSGLLAITILVFAACNSNKQNNQHDHNMHNDSTNHNKMQMDTMKDMKHDSMSEMNQK